MASDSLPGPSFNMKLAALQFDAKVGQVGINIACADAILAASPMKDVDLLVLPELAFTGYNHTSASIASLLEPTAKGVSAQWAISTAAKFDCLVTVGYPERCTDGLELLAYNSTVTVDRHGGVLAHYRKTHLYYTDESWAKEGPDQWLVTDLPFHQHADTEVKDPKVLSAAFGICMDLNPYQFTAPWDAYEFCTAAIERQAQVLVLSMAWLSSLPATELKGSPLEPDHGTFSYWINRLMPFLEIDNEVIIVCANRVGEEDGNNPCGQVEEGVRYAGSSWIGKISNGRVSVWGMLGRYEEGLLVADLKEPSKLNFRVAKPIVTTEEAVSQGDIQE